MVVWKFFEEIHGDEAQGAVLGSVRMGKGQKPIRQFKNSFFQHLAESCADGPVNNNTIKRVALDWASRAISITLLDSDCVTHMLTVCWSKKVTGLKITWVVNWRHLDCDQLHNLHHSDKRMSLPLQDAFGRRKQWLGKRGARNIVATPAILRTLL